MIRRLLSWSLWVLLWGAPARAEPPAITWDECVQEAAANNAELRTARANLAAAAYKADAAYSGNLPQLSAGAGYTDTSGSVVGDTGTTAYSTSLSLTQNLFAGFQDQAKIEQGAANRTAAEASLAAARARLSQDLKAAYAGLLYAQENIVLTEKIVRRLEENLRLVELRFEGGRENKGSYLFSQASLAQARYEYLQAQQAVVSAQAQLARALGRAARGALRVAEGVPLAEPGAAPDFAQLARGAPDYLQVQAQERSATADVALARSGFYPSVNLSGSVGREGPDWAPQNDRRTVGLNLTLPLFSGGKDYYATKSASASLEAASSGKDNVERQLFVRLRQTYAGYVEAAEKLKVDRQFVEAATARAEIARSRYDNGLMTFDDWDRIESDLIQRSKSLLVSRRDRVNAEAAWEQAQGKGVIP